MRFDVLTLFPGMFPSYLGQSLLKLAIEHGLIEVQLHDIRDWATDKHHTVDDRPFGGGPGMVLKVEPVVECVEAVRALSADPGHLVMLTPQGRRLDQAEVEELARRNRLLLCCADATRGLTNECGKSSSRTRFRSATLLWAAAKWPPW